MMFKKNTPHFMRNFILLYLFMLVSATISAQTAFRGEEPLPLEPALRLGKLDNGLTYYIRQHKVRDNRALFWLVINAGSVLEDDDQRGLAHFVEHMAFNGTERFEKNSMIDFAEQAGIEFGADLNAYTSYDETVYMLTVPTDNEKTMATAMDILSEWADSLSFDPEEVAKERGVVIEEWRRGRGARQRISDAQQQILLAGSKYADRNPIGVKAILENAPVVSLERYYKDWYRPDLMAVIVVGDIEPDQVEEQIRQRFSDLEFPARIRERRNIPVILNNRNEIAVVTDAEASRSIISMSIKGPLTPTRTESEYRYSLIENLFNGMLKDRLDEIRRSPESPFLMAFSNISEFVFPVASLAIFH